MWCRLVRDNSIQIFHDVVLFEGLTYILKWEVVGEDKIFFFSSMLFLLLLLAYLDLFGRPKSMLLMGLQCRWW